MNDAITDSEVAKKLQLAQNYEEFERLFNDENYPSHLLVEYLDRNTPNPTFKHFMDHQRIWMRDRRRDMIAERTSKGVEEKLGEMELVLDYQINLSPTNYESYYLKYIVPVFCDPEKSRNFLNLPVEDIRWVGDAMDKVFEFTRGKNLLEAIREKDPDLAQRLKSEGRYVGVNDYITNIAA